jgi:cbb3-type cytochrome oxidase maturation protein
VSIIYVLLPAAMVLAAFFVWAFVRAVRRGQYDDLDTPAVRMLHDDDPVKKT